MSTSWSSCYAILLYKFYICTLGYTYSWYHTYQTTELVMCGVATGLVVLKTAVHAIDQDLEVTVLSDLCVDADQARHDACMDAVFPTLARVLPSDEWLATLGSPQKTAAGALRGLL